MLNPIIFEIPPIYSVSRWFRNDLLGYFKGKTLRIVISLDHGGRNLCCGSGDQCHDHWCPTARKFVRGAVDHRRDPGAHFRQLAPFLAAFTKFEFHFANALPYPNESMRRYYDRGFETTDYERILNRLRQLGKPVESISLTWHHESMYVLEGRDTGGQRARQRTLRAERWAAHGGNNYLDWRFQDPNSVLAQLVAPLRQLRCKEIKVQMPKDVETPAYVKLVEAEMKSDCPIVDLDPLFERVQRFDLRYKETMYYLPFAVEPCMSRKMPYYPCLYCPKGQESLEYVSTQWKEHRPDLQREAEAACMGELSRQREFWNVREFAARADAISRESIRVVRLIKADEDMYSVADDVVRRWLGELIVQAETIRADVKAESEQYTDWQRCHVVSDKVCDLLDRGATLGVAHDECLTVEV